MASLKDLRTRIASVKATQKITKAMQMVAAAKLRRAQEAAEAARPYSQRMGAVLANIAANTGGDDAPRLMSGTGKDDVHLLLVCTAERGLCGGFNSQIARLAREHARSLLASGKTVKIGWWDPVMFEGILHLKQTESVYGASYYEMEGIDSKPYAPPAKK